MNRLGANMNFSINYSASHYHVLDKRTLNVLYTYQSSETIVVLNAYFS